MSRYKNQPPKEIKNAIWMGFDYRDVNSKVSRTKHSDTIGEAIYDVWQLIHKIAKNDPETFMKWVNNHEPDLDLFEFHETDDEENVKEMIKVEKVEEAKSDLKRVTDDDEDLQLVNLADEMMPWGY